MENVTMRNRKSAEQPKAKHEPTLADLYTSMASIDKRLTSLEQDMKLRVSEIENSLDEAYKTIADQENRIKILQDHIQDLEKSQVKTRLSKNCARRSLTFFFTAFLKLRLKKYKNVQNT